jgi:hypothetical protein
VRLLTRHEVASTGDDVANGSGGKQRHVPFRATGARHPILRPM